MADISVAEEFLQDTNDDSKKDEDQLGLDSDDRRSAPKRRKRGKTQENSDARRESHKLIEQKRRQKINEKINELRELLNYPDGSQNKAVVLQSAVDNIRYLKLVCNKLAQHHRQLQEENVHLVNENERFRKVLAENGLLSSVPTATKGLEGVSTSADQMGLDKSNQTDKASMNYNVSTEILRGLHGTDIGFLYPEENHPHTMAMLNNLATSPTMPYPRNYGTSLMHSSMVSQSMTNPSTFTEASGLPLRDQVGVSSNSGVSATGNPSSPITSTETENGVSITRLIYGNS